MSAPAPARPRAGGRILIVDDNEDAADTTATLLRFEGFEARTVGDAQRALSALVDFDAQVAILDIGLPGMSGYELAKRLRREAPRVRLVALTGYGTESDHERSREAGFDEHLVKPVLPERLLDVLDRLLVGDAR